MVRQSVIIAANSEVVFPVTVKKRRVEPTPLAADLGLHILEPCYSSCLQDRGLIIARTLVKVGETSSVPVRPLATGRAAKYSYCISQARAQRE